MNLALQRLHAQHIAGGAFRTPVDVVSWLGAVQAQDYLGARWAIGLRMKGDSEARIEAALADRTIIRTWPMRGTLHFVAAADVRWMLPLLTPRIVTANAGRLERHYGLDERVFARSRDVFRSVLEGGRQLSRNAMYRALEFAGISASAQRGLHILWRLAQDGLICFGVREGKQPTFVLLDEWVPDAGRLERDEALAELARRYFTGHGPATVQDFAWWSGLTTIEATTGLEMVKANLISEAIAGRHYWFSAVKRIAKAALPGAHILPAYDEYIVAYRDRSAVLHPLCARRPSAEAEILNPTIIIDGRVVGLWKRVLKKDSVEIVPRLFRKLDNNERHALAMAADRYGEFLALPVVVK